MSTIWLRQILYSKISSIVFHASDDLRNYSSEIIPSVTNCHTLLDSLQKICLMHDIEVNYYKNHFKQYSNHRKGWYSPIPVIFRRCFSVHGEMPLLERLENNHSGITSFCKSKYLQNCIWLCLSIRLSGNYGNENR